MVDQTFGLRFHHLDVPPLVPERENVVVRSDEANLLSRRLHVAVEIDRGFQSER